MSLQRYELLPSEILNDLSPEEKASIKRQFDLLDKDKDGHLNIEELCFLLQACKVDSHLASLAIALCDVDGDGTISYDEFGNFALLYSQLPQNPSVLYRNMFDLFDEDGSGYLEENEIKKFISYFTSGTLTDEKYKSLLKSVDTDGDGKLNFDEVCKFLDIITKV